MIENPIIHKENLYKESRDAIEKKIAEILLSPENREKVIFSFFGTEKDVLTVEEEKDFHLYAEYALKRILNATLHKYEIQKGDGAEAIRAMNSNLDMALALHDIGHSIAIYGTSSDSGEESVLPLFHQTQENEEINNIGLIREEPGALIWMNPFFSKPIPLALLDDGEKKELISVFKKYAERLPEMTSRVIDSIKSMNTADFDSYLDTYQDVIYGLVEITNTNAIESQNKETPDAMPSLKEGYLNIVRELKMVPDTKLVEALGRIYENQEDPKILYKEFYKICEPLINKLRKRN